MSGSDFHGFVSNLYEAQNFEQAFKHFESEILNLGFDGVLYTYIPRLLINNRFQVNPVYHVSQDYSPQYMNHYTEARFDRTDPLVKAVDDGVSEPISWQGDVCRSYMTADSNSAEVIETARDYGIHNGITLPLLSGNTGIAGASVISEETTAFNKLMESRIETLQLYTRLFHNLVLSNAPFKSEFVKPLLGSLSNTEMQLLIGLAKGQSPAQIAYELGKSEGYLEQVMIKLRRKFSGVDTDESPLINRNQLLYYAGLLNILDQPDQ